MMKRTAKYVSLAALSFTLSACNNLFGPQQGYPGHQGYYSQSTYHNSAYAPSRGHAAPRHRAVNVNYEALSAVEAPLAYEVGDVTLALRGRIDAPLEYSFERNDGINGRLIANHQISAETQLPNRITVGAAYGGRFETARNNPGSTYSDDVAVYAGGSWGTVFGGNVSDIVYEETRRLRGVTQQRLAGDGALGGLNDWSGGYRGRYGPATVSAAIDEDANYDVGVSFQRPIGTRDYRITARHNNGHYLAADGITELDTKSVSAVGEYVYGSSRFDVGGGYEKIEDADRWFASAGASTKHGVWSLSAEGHYGQIDGQDEISAVIGLRRDIARGLAVTAAVDYEDRQINVNGVDYLNTEDTRVIMALSYGF